MRVRIKKLGPSEAVQIPASVMAAAALSLNQMVEMTEDGDRLILKPITPAYELDRLVARREPDTFPEPADFGAPVVREAF